MTPETATIIAAWAPYLGPPLAGLALAASAWVVSKLPGPIRDALVAFVSKTDNAAILAAAESKAAEMVRAPGVTPTVAAVAAYIRAELPDLIAKVQPSTAALSAISAKAIQQSEAVAAVAGGPQL